MDLYEKGMDVSVNDEKCGNNEESTDVLDVPAENEEYLGGPVFEPPLYMQRYYFVEQQLEKFNVKHVVDFGSAECKISRFLVQLPTMEKLDLVDLNGDLLQSKIHAIRPLTSDFLDKRDLPLHVRMLQGSVTELDSKILGCDAVSMVEIIEHLNPDVLKGAVEMVFGKLQPNVVMVTTPNSEFNQLFPNFTGMRHWDHKFEWTRKEMQAWCEEICQCYPYSVEYGGVGEPPVDNTHLGHCSQYAVFVRDATVPKFDSSKEALDSYVIISESFYPFKENILSDEDIILAELKYQTRQYQFAGFSFHCGDTCTCDKGNHSLGQLPVCHRQVCSKHHNYIYESDVDSGIQSVFHPEENQSESHTRKLQYCVYCSRIRMEKMCRQFIPIKYLMNRTIKKKMSFDQLQIFLQKHGYNLSGDGLYIVVDFTNSEIDSEEELCNEDAADDEFNAIETLPKVHYCSDIPKIHSNFNLEDALLNDDWELEDI